MKKYLSYILGVMLVACQQEPVEFSETASQTNPDKIPIDSYERQLGVPIANAVQSTYSAFDWSGQVETRVWWNDFGSPSSICAGSVTIPSDWVLVGGGALTYETDPSKGAFLTESRPDWSINTWKARSKDHVHVDPHRLRIYAVGLRIQGVTAATLRTVMTEAHSISVQQAHPSTFASLTGSYKLVGGGARVNYPTGDDGNLLVHTYPFLESWYVKSKDHINACDATIEAWAIGIQENIPGFGNIEVWQDLYSNSASTPTGLRLVAMQPIIGNAYAPTCPGAQETYPVNQGRMLCSIVPAKSESLQDTGYASSKDIIIATTGRMYVQSIVIGKKH